MEPDIVPIPQCGQPADTSGAQRVDYVHDCKTPRARAVLDKAHIGDFRGALGTIRHSDISPRRGWWPRLRTLLAILGPGLIVMVGDNDAGAFSTYTQARQDYGTSLLWTLLLLVPVFYSSSPALYHHVIKYPIDRSLNPPGKYGQGVRT